MEIDFVRIGNVRSAADGDLGWDGMPRPDGLVDSEDNCPTVWNASQADENLNGIGDVCEDIDGDAIPNFLRQLPGSQQLPPARRQPRRPRRRLRHRTRPRLLPAAGCAGGKI